MSPGKVALSRSSCAVKGRLTRLEVVGAEALLLAAEAAAGGATGAATIIPAAHDEQAKARRRWISMVCDLHPEPAPPGSPAA
jgi:hypothetical protein